jgi:hypothetical protein
MPAREFSLPGGSSMKKRVERVVWRPMEERPIRIGGAAEHGRPGTAENWDWFGWTAAACVLAWFVTLGLSGFPG